MWYLTSGICGPDALNLQDFCLPIGPKYFAVVKQLKILNIKFAKKKKKNSYSAPLRTRASLIDMHNDAYGLLFWQLQQHIISKLLRGRVALYEH